jgi:tyrosine-protein phosphatase SIW14
MKCRFCFHQSFSLLVALTLVSATTFASYTHSSQERETASRASARVSIDNFGQVNDRIYRGSQPKDDQYQDLAKFGIRTVVDLRAEANTESKPSAERAGLRYIHLPLGDKTYPPTEAAARFLEIVNDKANWPVYVHCAGGRHRTGAMLAVYRMKVDGWTVEQAYAEMKRFGYYQRNSHGRYKKYVYDYYRSLPASSEPKNATAPNQPKKAKRSTP